MYGIPLSDMQIGGPTCQGRFSRCKLSWGPTCKGRWVFEMQTASCHASRARALHLENPTLHVGRRSPYYVFLCQFLRIPFAFLSASWFASSSGLAQGQAAPLLCHPSLTVVDQNNTVMPDNKIARHTSARAFTLQRDAKWLSRQTSIRVTTCIS